jgi:Short C-terminal domain
MDKTTAKTLALALFMISAVSHPAIAAKGKGADFTVWTERDSFKPGVVVVRSTPIRVKEVQFLKPWFALLEAGYIYSEDGSFGTYFMEIMYHGSEWMFWEELTAKIGTEVQSFQLVGQPRRDTVSMGVQERARFTVPREFFEKMTAAPSIDFRVNGKFYYDFFLNSTGASYLAQLRDFVREKTPALAVPKDESPEAAGREEAAGSAIPSYVQELRELAKLRAEGIISEEEFEAKKRRLLDLEDAQAPPPAGGVQKEEAEKENSEAPPASPPPSIPSFYPSIGSARNLYPTHGSVPM